MSRTRTDAWNVENAHKLYGARTAEAIYFGIHDRSPRELNQILNARPDPIDQRDYIYEPSLIDLPARYFNPICKKIDFRIKDQGAEGTCVGQSLASVIELQNLLRLEEGAKVPKRVSARFLYSNAQLYDHHPDDSLEGTSLRGAIKGFYHNGVCDDKDAPYVVQEENFLIRNRMWENARSVALGTYFRLEHVLNHYHTALKESGSIFCSAIIHDGWNHEAVNAEIGDQKAGRIKYPHTITPDHEIECSSKPCKLSGGHAFVIVGYDDTGFLVLNSWGNLWGRFPVANLQDPEHPLGDTSLAGIAHWSYEDWADNVLDAWILRLAAPTGHGTDFVGGRPKRQTANGSRSSTARKRDVQGHYMHLRDGNLVKEPPYENRLAQFEEIASDIVESNEYKHVVLFAHGGLNTIDSASARAAAMIPTFKEHGIYPLFYFWRTGFGHMLGSVIEGILPEIEKRSQDYTELKDASIERLAKPIGRAIWNDIRRNAAACFDEDYDEYCEKKCECMSEKSASQKAANTVEEHAWHATRALIDGCAKFQGEPIKFHFIGHSAGVFLLGELFKRLEKERMLNADWLGSVNLMVPCCSTEHFNQSVVNIIGKHLGEKCLTVFNLNPASESSIDPAMAPYGKSFASLVSNAFYDEKPKSIAALHEYWNSDIEPFISRKNYGSKVDYVWPDHRYEDDSPKCSAAYHGEFDNDADTMNYILNKILGNSLDDRITPSLGGFSYEQLNHRGF